MTDSNGSSFDQGGPNPFAMPPAGPPPPPPAAVAAPPVGSPPPPPIAPAAAYAPPAPAPRKKRTWLWVLLVLGLLGCCIAAVVAAIVGGVIASSADTAATVKAADEHYVKAVSVIKDLSDRYSALGGAEAGDAAVQKLAGETTARVSVAREELTAASTEIAKLETSEARTTYEQGIAETDKALEAIDAMAQEMSGKSTAMTEITAGLQVYKQGSEKMNEAIGALNNNKWTPGGTAAGQAKDFYEAALVRFRKAGEIDPTAGMEQMVAYVDLQFKRASVAVQLANQGSRGNLTDYNRLIKEYNALNDQLDAATQPAAITDPNWATARAGELLAQAGESLTKGAGLVEKARTLYSGDASGKPGI
jgi:hypothetical protein